jgi:hypothetical protein
MGMTEEADIRQTWGSHMPFLTAVVEALKPDHSVECGCGNYSTPIIAENSKHLLTIEHDTAWARRMMKQRDGKHPSHAWKVDAFAGVNNATRRPDLSPNMEAKIGLYYSGIRLPKTDFLFVDTFTACRVPAMIHLSQFADVVMLHDTEGQSPQHYNFDQIGNRLDGWQRYRYAPEGMVKGQWPIPWTDVWSREVLDLTEIQPIADRESEKLWGIPQVQIRNITGAGWFND